MVCSNLLIEVTLKLPVSIIKMTLYITLQYPSKLAAVVDLAIDTIGKEASS